MAVEAAVVVAADTPPSVVMHPQAAVLSAAAAGPTTRAHRHFGPAATPVATTVVASRDPVQSAAPLRPQVMHAPAVASQVGLASASPADPVGASSAE
jgi:hypothetical protein